MLFSTGEVVPLQYYGELLLLLPLHECSLVAVEGLECLYDPKSYAGGRVISW